VIANGRVRDPGEILLELEGVDGMVGVRVVERQVKREDECEQREDERDPVMKLFAFALGQAGKHRRAHERGEEDLREDEAVRVHGSPVVVR